MDTIFATELLLSIGSIGCLSWKIAGTPLLEEKADRAADGQPDPRVSAPEAPVEVPKPDFTRLRWALTSDRVPMRLAAVAELSMLPGAEALSLISGLVRDPDYDIRRLAVQRIAAERDPACTDVLLQATRDVRIEVQNAACEGLIGVKDERVTELFRRLALQGLHYARLLGIRGLGAAGGEEKLLLEIHRGSSGKIREETVIALAGSREPEALEAVRDYLKLRLEQGPAGQRQEPVDEAQFRQVLEQEPALALIEELEAACKELPPSRRKGEVLAKLSGIARDRMADERRRYLAVRGIGFLGGQPLLEQLQALAQDFATAVRFAATIAIGRLRTVKAIEPLKRALGDSSFLVRGTAVVFLDQMGHSIDRQIFEAALQDSDVLVRDLAAKALSSRPLTSRFGAGKPAAALPGAAEPAQAGQRMSLVEPPVLARERVEVTAAAAAPAAPKAPSAMRSDRALDALLKPMRRSPRTRPPSAVRLHGDGKKLTLSEVLRRA